MRTFLGGPRTPHSKPQSSRWELHVPGLALLTLLVVAMLALPSPSAAQSSLPEGVTMETYGDQAFLLKDGKPWLPPLRESAGPRGTLAPNQIEIAMVADAAFVERYGDESEARICGLVASTRELLRRSAVFDFELHHTETILNAGSDPYAVTPEPDGEVDPSSLLQSFRVWANANVGANDVAALVSGYDLSDSTVGFAFTGAACTVNSALITQHFGDMAFDASTLAHELGHNLGMCHDPPASRNPAFCSDLSGVVNPEESCPGHIMAASLNPSAPDWEYSECSVADHQRWLSTTPSSACLTNAPSATVDCSAFVCPELPQTGCAQAQSTLLKISRGKTAKANQIKWNWKKGEELLLGDLGDPSDTTDYMLCMYDGSGGVPLGVSRLRVPANDLWASKADKGWQYKEKAGVADGVRKASLRPGDAGKSKISVLAKGVGTPLPFAVDTTRYFELLPALQVQLINSDGECWEAAYTIADAKKNEANKFLAKTK